MLLYLLHVVTVAPNALPFQLAADFLRYPGSKSKVDTCMVHAVLAELCVDELEAAQATCMRVAAGRLLPFHGDLNPLIEDMEV